MNESQERLLDERKKEFANFYKALMPTLVDFVERLGVTPAHAVLNQADQYVTYLESALRDMEITDDDDRLWLLNRMAYFIGEYFAQLLDGCWYVYEVVDSPFFARYVVGKFEKISDPGMMIDPYEIAHSFIESPIPRELSPLLSQVLSDLLPA
jgi:hypothetical protein